MFDTQALQKHPGHASNWKGTANHMSKDLVQGSRKHISLTSWVAFCLCMLSFAARAQVDQGTVTGTVMDQEGAVIPNVNATVTDLGTALKLETPKPAQLCKIFLDKISEDDLRCSRPRNVYVIIIENPPIRRKSRGLAVRSHRDHLSLNLSDRTTPRLGVRL
jgi:hypothetical protein